MAQLDALARRKPRTSARSDSGAMRGHVSHTTSEGVFVVLDYLPGSSYGPCSGQLAAGTALLQPVLVMFADDDQADPWIVARG